MKLKIVVLDLELTRREKRVGAVALALASALVTSVALAEVVPFAAGETLTAAKLNANFADLDERLTAQSTDAAELDTRLTDAEMAIATLEAAPTFLVSTSNVAQTGAFATDLVYDAMELTLQPGTWLVESSATMYTSGNSDQVQLGLWNQTAAAEVANSKGPVGTSVALNGGNFCGAGQTCLAAPTSASAVVTVAVPTVMRAKGFRNGSSTLTIGPPNSGVVLAPLNRISALKLR
jgi:hypothetical protein